MTVVGLRHRGVTKPRTIGAKVERIEKPINAMKSHHYHHGYTVARTLWRAGFNVESRIPSNDYNIGWNASLRREMFIQRAGNIATKLALVALVGGLIYLALVLT